MMREEEKQFLGYYDTELSEEAPPGTYGKPTIRKAELLNEEALILKFSWQHRISHFGANIPI